MSTLAQTHEREAGAAMVEAIVTVPAFAAVLAAIVALNGMYSAKLEAKARARRLAWLQADSGACPPQSCKTGECGRIEHDIRTGGLDDLLEVRDDRFALDSLLGDLGRFLFGKSTRGVGVASSPMPSLVSASLGSQHGVTTLLCNTTTRHSGEIGNVLEHACRTDLNTTEYAREVCR